MTTPGDDHRINVGDIVVRQIDETPFAPATGAWLLPSGTADVVGAYPWLTPDYVDSSGGLALHSRSIGIESGDVRILVDTGVGNGKQRENPAWNDLKTDYLSHLPSAGFAPDVVDMVVLTHLHTDHVGWNTTNVNGRWVPTFGNARYLTSRIEWEFWTQQELEPARAQMFADSVVPVADAKLLDLVDVSHGDVEIAPGVSLVAAPGHTPGQVAVRITSRGETAVISGDALHHPVQLARPDMCAVVDIDPGQANATRWAMLDALADTGTVLIGTHFPSPAAGYVVRASEGFRFEPYSPKSDEHNDPRAVHPRTAG